MEEPDSACCPRGQPLSEQQWKELIDAGHVLKPLLWRRWRGFRSSIEDAVTEAITNVAAKVMKGAMAYPKTFDALRETHSLRKQPHFSNAKNAIACGKHHRSFRATTIPRHLHTILSVGLSSRWICRQQSQNSPRSFVRLLIWCISMTNPSSKRQKRSAARQIHSSSGYFERETT